MIKRILHLITYVVFSERPPQGANDASRRFVVRRSACQRTASLCTVLFLAILTSSASESLANEAETPEFSAEDLQFFEKRVRPVLVERCFECHSTKPNGTSKVNGGLRLDSRNAALRGGDSGPAAIPANAQESLLIRSIGYDAEIQMPPTGKLAAAEIAVLTEWVERGLPFPREGLPDNAAMANDWTVRRNHWSFRPLRDVEPAPLIAPTQGWCQNRVDAYVSREWESRGLSSVGTADPRSLLRRLTFDLTGLPPANDEQDDYLQTELPDRTERLIDRLLASPRYGERWGRHWLDLVRYCDVPESWRETGAKAWLYRDWIATAWNRDLPYNEFIRKQFAADLLPDFDPQENAALGLLGLSPSYWKELKLDPLVIKQVVAEEWEERVEALGATFLGLTLACARCHDHKYDPITMQDYYGLAGILASIRQEDLPTIPAAEATIVKQALDQAKVLQAEIDKLAATEPMREEIQSQIEHKRAELAAVKRTPHFESPWVYGVSEASLHVVPDGPQRTKLEYHENQPQDLALQIRGNPGNTGAVVPRRFLTSISFSEYADKQTVSEEEVRFRTGSGRLEFADALVTRAAPLTARVMVNRVWRQHFGRGLVTTVSNFGLQGERPSHPELLDDLSRRFVERDWSIKGLQRELLLSATFRQAARVDGLTDRSSTMASGQDRDPENVWLWRSPVRRLDLEAWRDSMLFAAMNLDLSFGGAAQSLNDPANSRRTIYGQVKRRELIDFQRLHDFPDPVSHSAAREPTTTPLQQLFTLNSPFLQRQAQLLEKVLRDRTGSNQEALVDEAYLQVLGRLPTQDECAGVLAFMSSGESDVVTQFLHALLASNEFQFID